LYGVRPYSEHLDEVAVILRAFGESAVAIGYLHDVLEDTMVPATVLEDQFGALVTRCVRLLTDEPGDSRADRKAATYRKLRAIPPGSAEELALVVKAADRLANVRACLRDNPRKLAIYRDEHPAFRGAIRRQELSDEIWRELDQAIG
jgi:(p)ppGpp synthase/HD superfamily hydrolase